MGSTRRHLVNSAHPSLTDTRMTMTPITSRTKKQLMVRRRRGALLQAILAQPSSSYRKDQPVTRATTRPMWRGVHNRGSNMISRIVLRQRIPGLFLPRQHFSTNSVSPSTRLITYLTDVEGDAAYLDRYVENSRVLRFSADSVSAPSSKSEKPEQQYPQGLIDFTSDNAILIFGGDIWDKGGSDLYVIRQLLSLKNRYPDRVHFILGNRDINKMRLWQEIQCDTHGGVWWRPEWKPDPSWSSSRRLQWILANTMGSPKAFEHRRNELQREQQQQSSSSSGATTISDEQVLQSYLDSCHALDGEMGEYLSHGQLILSIGQLLVVHGALPWMAASTSSPTDEAAYQLSLPWLSSAEQQERSDISPSEWIDSLNDFCQSQLDQWRQSFDQSTDGAWATVGGFHYSPQSATSNHSYSGLMQYGMGWLPSKERIPTIVYSSWIQNGMPRKFFPKSDDDDDDDNTDLLALQKQQTLQFMDDANVQVILSGHQPQGDLPTPIRLDDNGSSVPPKLILACDTSYSGDVQWFYKNGAASEAAEVVGGRGSKAVCEVLLEQCPATGYIHTVMHHGVLSNGQSFESTNLLTDPTIGRLLSTAPPDTSRPWWVKAQLKDTQLLSTAEGYNVVNAIVPTN
jgi:hypothetical protein